MNFSHQTKQALSEIFGFNSFKPNQEGIVNAILSGKDSFAVMPTGGGKSLCYQLPAYLLGGVCIVVSPLISLMKDQVDSACANGLRAATLNSTITDRERSSVFSALNSDSLDLLYVSPERFNSEGFCDWIKNFNVSFFAIDEAHCISEWGHDFRPDYMALSRISEEFNGVPVAAFTATATERVADDIVERLRLQDAYFVRASFNRPNLYYQVAAKNNLDKQLLDFLTEHESESGIIYRTTRKNVEATADMLCANGINAKAYHAGLADDLRSSVQDDFQRDECEVIVATIAFGMGIDKSNVRFVVHADLPKNIEGYYQETGRAGRDGEASACALFYGRQDIVQLRRFASMIEDEHAQKVAYFQLQQMIDFAQNDGCRRAALLKYFGENLDVENCGGCDVCSGDVERVDATIEAQKALSAIVRTSGRFGAAHIADVLVGANTKRIRENRHNEIPTYGVGKDKDKIYWKLVLDALLAQGFTRIDDIRYPVPAVTEEGWKILRGEKPFQMIKVAEPSSKEKKKKEKQKKSAAVDTPYSHALFEKLREQRMLRAKADNVPPYIVFSDKTLHELARKFPTNNEQMLEITGIGKHKLEVYGSDFLDVITEFVRENPEEVASLLNDNNSDNSGGEEDNDISAFESVVADSAGTFSKTNNNLTDTEMETLKFILVGKSLWEIADERNLKVSTISGHIERIIGKGYEISFRKLISQSRLEYIAEEFKKAEDWNLSSIVESGDGEIDYAEARLVRTFLKTQE